MTTAEPQRLRVPLTAPQAVTHTSAVIWQPQQDAGGCGVLLAPSAGATLAHPLLRALGRGLARRGHPTCVFNFAYAEAGRRRPDPAVRLERAYRDVAAAVRLLFGTERGLALGGRSMGGRIASHLAADGEGCAGLVLLSYPLHQRRRSGEGQDPARLRTGHWPRIGVPMLFVQGDRDPLCNLELLDRERRALPSQDSSTLHVVQGTDHGFGVRRGDGRAPIDVLAEIVDTVGTWLDALPASAKGRT